MKMVMVVNPKSHLIHTVGGTILRPGVNSVPEKIAKQIDDDPHMKDVGVKVSKEAPSTKKLKPAAAEALIAKTNDPVILDSYRDEDDRPSVAAAIADKKVEIAPTEVKKG